MQDFKKLSVWGKAHQLTLRVYEATRRFPREELFCLTQQMGRASSSIPTNIAEGCGRGTAADFARFLQMAMGSACELEYQLILARDLNYLSAERHPAFRCRCLRSEMDARGTAQSRPVRFDWLIGFDANKRLTTLGC